MSEKIEKMKKAFRMCDGNPFKRRIEIFVELCKGKIKLDEEVEK